MKLAVSVLAAGAAFLALSVGILMFATKSPEEAVPAAVAEDPMSTTTTEAAHATTSANQAAVPQEACRIGVPGPASSPFTGQITHAMKDAAVDALLAREKLFLENDPGCLRAYSLAIAVSPEQREEIERQDEKTLRATALMMALIMDLPEPAEVRRLMLKEDAVWEYKEGEVHVTVTIDDAGEKVVGHADDGTPVYGTDNGWGTTIFYRDGRWY